MQTGENYFFLNKNRTGSVKENRNHIVKKRGWGIYFIVEII
jgi:hypothetical protein